MEQRPGYVLVTGSSSGIGVALARRLAPTAKLILHGRQAERLRSIQSELPNADSHMIWAQDLQDPFEGTEALRTMLDNAGATVEAFVHCASSVSSPLTDTATVARLFQVNVFSATAILRMLLKKSVNRGALRSVVLISCVTSRFGAKGLSIHAATKGALESLARSLAVELAPEVRVNVVVPGEILAKGDKSLDESESESELGGGYLLGAGRADDAAMMAEHLVSDKARWITGQQFVVDGGKTAH